MNLLSVNNSNTPQYITVNDGQQDQRIDNYLIKSLKNVPKSHIYRILRKGEVRVNKGRVKANYRLQCGDIVRLPPIRLNITEPPKAGARQLDWIQKSILYEDDQLLVINKPSGLAVHGGSGISLGAIECLRQARPEARYLELVHRLDRETSGCLIFAKKRSCLRYLHELFRTDGIKKTYLALLKGQWIGGTKHIKEALRKNIVSSGERIVCVDPDGKPAHSIFKPLEVHKSTTLVQVNLKTGRTHQIRVHAAHVGFPIVGDDKYGDKDFNKLMRKLNIRRLFLHAESVTFVHPVTQLRLHIKAPLDENLLAVMDKLKNNG